MVKKVVFKLKVSICNKKKQALTSKQRNICFFARESDK